MSKLVPKAFSGIKSKSTRRREKDEMKKIETPEFNQEVLNKYRHIPMLTDIVYKRKAKKHNNGGIIQKFQLGGTPSFGIDPSLTSHLDNMLERINTERQQLSAIQRPVQQQSKPELQSYSSTPQLEKITFWDKLLGISGVKEKYNQQQWEQWDAEESRKHQEYMNQLDNYHKQMFGQTTSVPEVPSVPTVQPVVQPQSVQRQQPVAQPQSPSRSRQRKPQNATNYGTINNVYGITDSAIAPYTNNGNSGYQYNLGGNRMVRQRNSGKLFYSNNGGKNWYSAKAYNNNGNTGLEYTINGTTYRRRNNNGQIFVSDGKGGWQLFNASPTSSKNQSQGKIPKRAPESIPLAQQNWEQLGNTYAGFYKDLTRDGNDFSFLLGLPTYWYYNRDLGSARNAFSNMLKGVHAND